MKKDFKMNSLKYRMTLTLASAVGIASCSSHAPSSEIATAESSGNRAPAAAISPMPILDAIEAHGGTIAKESASWRKKWVGRDLEGSDISFPELSGSTSINLKVDRAATQEEMEKDKAEGKPADVTKSLGSFVARNGAANPNTEIAYFNLAAILGWDHIYRPAARYELGSKAIAGFQRLIAKTTIKGTQRLENKAKILAAMKTPPLKGTLKAKKISGDVSVDAMANTGAAPNGAPASGHPIIKALQVGNPFPSSGTQVTLKAGYVNDARTLAQEYSVIMMLDTVFQQWDRYSGGNIVIYKDKDGKAHFYATDNGGADLGKTTSWTERNAGWFSRYDKKAVLGLRKVHAFLSNPSGNPLLGYTDAEKFVEDLGLYFELSRPLYVERLRRNIGILLAKVDAVVAKHGESNAYFE